MTHDFIKLFNEHRTKIGVANALDTSRPTLDSWIKESDFDFKKWKKIADPASPKRTRSKRVVVTKQKPLPSYKTFIKWCEDNPDLPFTDQMWQNCEGKSRKHWRSIIQTGINLLKRYMEDSTTN